MVEDGLKTILIFPVLKDSSKVFIFAHKVDFQ